MFDREKLERLFASHVPGRRLTLMQVSVATGIYQSMLSKMLKQDGMNPSLETLERLAKFFFGDHRMISEFSDDRAPADKFGITTDIRSKEVPPKRKAKTQ